MIVWLEGANGGVGRFATPESTTPESTTPESTTPESTTPESRTTPSRSDGQPARPELVSAQRAALSVQDRGLTVGDGAFETLKVLPDGTPFALTRHLARLAGSARALDIVLPAADHLRAAVGAVVAANADQLAGRSGRLRITVTQGLGVLSDPYAGQAAPTLLITVVPKPAWGATSRVALSRYRRNPDSALAGVKSTSYAENAIALRAAKSRGADEALLLSTDGHVCEGTGSNIFAVIDGHLRTPPLDSGCLNGITRQLVVEWCAAVEAPISVTELAQAEEVFITSSTRDIHPVSRLDLWAADGPVREFAAPGPVTAAAMATWRDREAADADP